MAERAFKGVWIPKEVWLDEELGWSEKLLLVEIDSLDNEDGCWASNEYFASFFGLSKGRISKIISTLKEKGYINVELIYKKGTRQVEKRVIRMCEGYSRKRLGGIVENSHTPIVENNHTPIVENSEDNNTVLNNTVLNNTKDTMLGKPNNVDYKMIVEYLNEKAKTNFRSGTKATQRLIDARVNEGFTVEDFKVVIDNKVLDWSHDEKMGQYLRPQTLFGTKFEAYLNEKPKKEQRAKMDMGVELSEELGF